MTVATPEMCRVTVVTPKRWADVALPAGEPLVGLLTALVGHVGDPDLEGRPLALQRLGSPPLDPDRSLAGNGVLDGETLYLNAVEHTMPPVYFDDAIAGLGAGIEGLANRWKPVDTRLLLLSVAPLPASVAWLVLAGPGVGPGTAAATAAPASLLLVAAAGAASRAWGDRTLALVLGALAVPFAGLAGALAVVALSAAPALSVAAGLGGAAGVFAAAVAADAATGGLTAGFSGVAFGAVLVEVGCVIGLLAGWPPGHAVAVVLVLAVVAAEVAVNVACRLAGVFLPPLPRTADELEEGVEPVPAQDALTRAAQVDQYLTALLWGVAVVAAPSAVAVALGGGRWEVLLVAAASASALLRLRVYFGRGQRAALLVAGLAGPAALLVGLGLGGRGLGPAVVAIAGLVLTGAALAGAVHLPGRRTVPHVGRSAEILEALVAAGLLPLLLAVLGTYQAARNLR